MANEYSTKILFITHKRKTTKTSSIHLKALIKALHVYCRNFGQFYQLIVSYAVWRAGYIQEFSD